HRGHRGLDRGVTGEHDDGRGGQLGVEHLEEGEPVHPGHDQVTDDDAGAEGQRPVDGVPSVGRVRHLVTPLGEERGEPGAGVLVVVRDQDTLGHGPGGAPYPVAGVCPTSPGVARDRWTYGGRSAAPERGDGGGHAVDSSPGPGFTFVAAVETRVSGRPERTAPSWREKPERGTTPTFSPGWRTCGPSWSTAWERQPRSGSSSSIGSPTSSARRTR